jgi:hypothetical protein
MYKPSLKGHTFSFKLVVFTGCAILALAAFALAGQTPPAALAQGADEFFVTSFYTGFGWMLNSVTLDRFAFVPTSGAACYTGGDCDKIVWRQPQPSEWVGMYWVHPQAGVGAWSQPGQPGCNLTGATSVTFWARGERGGEKISWLAAYYALNEIETAPTTLTTAWAPYSIDLAGHDLTNVVGAFGYRVWGSINPTDTTFYIDRIAYQGITAAQLACVQNATATPTTQPTATSTATATPTTMPTPTPTMTATPVATPVTTPAVTPVTTPVVTPPPDAPLVLVYAVLDNNLMTAVGDDNWDRLINNLEAGVHDGVRVRLMIDGAGANNSYIYDLQHNEDEFCPSVSNPTCSGRYVDDVNRFVWTEDTAQPTSLSDFITLSVAQHPAASRLIVSLVGHGNGWSANGLPALPTRWSDQSEQVGGLLWDDVPAATATGGRSLSTRALGVALSRAVSTIGRSLDLLYLDACSMAIAEAAYEVRNTAHYLLASPNTVWASFPYHLLLKQVKSDSDAQAIGKAWLDVEAGELRPSYPFTLALIDLTQLEALLGAANTLADELISVMPTQRAVIDQSANASDRYESIYNGALNPQDSYADLTSFSVQLASRFGRDSLVGKAAIKLQQNVSAAVVYKDMQGGKSWKYPDNNWAWQVYGGLSIYLPIPVDDPTGKRLLYTGTNLQWAANGRWDEFLNAYWPANTAATLAAATAMRICSSTLDCTDLLARPMSFAEAVPGQSTSYLFIPFVQH